MNKTELADFVANRVDISKADATAAVDSVLDGITMALEQDDAVTLIGFGTFSISHRAERMGRNPRTGETISIAASRLPKFKPGKALKDRVN